MSEVHVVFSKKFVFRRQGKIAAYMKEVGRDKGIIEQSEKCVN